MPCTFKIQAKFHFTLSFKLKKKNHFKDIIKSILNNI